MGAKRALSALDRERNAPDKFASHSGAPSLASVVRGVLVALTSSGEPLVDFLHNPVGHPVPAISTVKLDASAVSSETILVFEDGDSRRPIIIGIVQTPYRADNPKVVDVSLDGRTLNLTGQEEVTLRCGEASITLTRSGKVVIKGSYVLSKAKGANRVQGASVQLN